MDFIKVEGYVVVDIVMGTLATNTIYNSKERAEVFCEDSRISPDYKIVKIEWEE